MSGSVTPLQLRRGSFDVALAAFRAALFRTCLSELRGIDSTAAAILRARTQLRLGNPAEALSAALCEAEDVQDRGELALLRGVAHSRLGADEQSDAAFLDARVFAISSRSSALESEVDFYVGLIAFGRGCLDDTRIACRRALDVAATPEILGKQRADVVPLGHVVARIQELLGLADAADGRYREQIPHARAALATLKKCPTPDVFQEAVAVGNLAILARDFDLGDDAHTIVARTDELAWNPEISHLKVRTVEALGWCSALRGNFVDALRRFRDAGEVASTAPEKVLLSVDRALIVRELGHSVIVVEEVEHALRLCETFDWEKAALDYRVALLCMAQVAAPIATERARRVLDRYGKIRKTMDGVMVGRLEARVRAEEAYTRGVVLRAEGQLDASTDQLQVAFGLWKNIGFEWRAARAALELAELDAGDVFRLAVRQELLRRPDSVFSSRARLVA